MKDLFQKMKDNDGFVFKEIFEMNTYMCNDSELNNATVIDAGANVGMFAVYAVMHGAKEVYAYESNISNFKTLVEFTKDLPNIKCINKAIFKPGVNEVYFSGDKGTSVVEQTGDTNRVACVSLDNIIDEILDDKLILKIDVEGAEYDILYYTRRENIKRLKNIYCEFHDTDLFNKNDLSNYIEDLGFEKTTSPYKIYVGQSEKTEVATYKFEKSKLKVTATVSTRNRYFTTLPLCIQSIALQTKVPDELIIYDDNPEDKRIDLRKEPMYQNLLSLLSVRGINWKVNFGTGEGQVKNHQRALTEAKHQLIWRLDDDNAPNPNVLETLLKHMQDGVGAVAGLVIDPKNNRRKHPLASNKIEDIFLGLNEQWYIDNFGYKEVDHLYSSFLFRKYAASHGYEKLLSRVGHREETIFTYQMKQNGWRIGITSDCITWHYHNPQGGIRDNTTAGMWNHDENVFKAKLKEWKKDCESKTFFVLNNGIGDHYAFKTLLPRIKEKYKNIVLATCYPEVFEDVVQISIQDAKEMFNDLSRWDVYKFMSDNNWKESMIKAYEKMYL